jgi:hypothetical protein
MNDLAEKALDGLIAARRAVAARPVPVLAVTGFAVAAAIVVTGGRLGAAPAAVPINRWLGLLPEAGYRITGVAMGLTMLGAIVALLVTWIVTFVVAVRAQFTERQLWTLAASWALPFVIGPPLLSTDVFADVARGLLSRAGLSPYTTAPSHLGELRIVDAIDPTWRGTDSSDGPLSTLLGHLVVTLCGGAVVPALLVFRLIALGSVIVVGRCASELATGRRPQTALCLTILNPLVLLYVVSAAQLVGLLIALLLVALVAARRRRWPAAAVMIALAAALKPAALVAVPVLIAYHAFGQPRREVWRRVLRDLGLVAAVFAVITVAVPRGLNWLANFGDAFHEHVGYTPSNAVANLIGLVVPAAYDDVQTGARIATAAAGVIAVIALLVTLRSRPLEQTLGLALLATALAAPVVYPQFVLWGLACLAPRSGAVQRTWLVALSCAACLASPDGLGARGGEVASFACIGGVLLAVVAVLAYQRRRSARTADDARPTSGNRRHIARAWPFLTAHRRDVDSAHDDLQHSLRLHHRQGGA